MHCLLFHCRDSFLEQPVAGWQELFGFPEQLAEDCPCPSTISSTWGRIAATGGVILGGEAALPCLKYTGELRVYVDLSGGFLAWSSEINNEALVENTGERFEPASGGGSGGIGLAIGD